MEKEKFMIKVRYFEGLKQIEVDGWTHKGLGCHKFDESDYHVTHLYSGSCLYYAETENEAKKFIETFTNNINCNCTDEELFNEIKKYSHIYKNARELATAV